MSGGVEEIDGAGEGPVLFVEDGSGEDGVSADRDGCAEPIARVAVIGHELRELGARVGVEEVHGARGVAVVLVMWRADDGELSADGDRKSEVVVRRAVRGEQLVELLTRDEVEEVGRAGAVPIRLVGVRTNDADGAAEGAGDPELARAVTGDELVSLREGLSARDGAARRHGESGDGEPGQGGT